MLMRISIQVSGNTSLSLRSYSFQRQSTQYMMQVLNGVLITLLWRFDNVYKSCVRSLCRSFDHNRFDVIVA